MRAWGEHIGAEIRTKRLTKGWGPTFFAGLIDVPLQTLHKIETGEIIPRDHLKAAIALALGVELSDLYPWPTAETLLAEVRKAAA